MKAATKIIAVAAALTSLAVAGVALAHPGQGMGADMMGHGMGTGMGMGHGMASHNHGPQMAGSAATHLGELKAQLKITTAQEPAWTKFEAFVRQQADAGAAMRAQIQAQMHDPKAAPSDHASQREAMGKWRESHQVARDAARKELFAVLTPEQKAIAEQHMSAGRGHRMAMQSPVK